MVENGVISQIMVDYLFKKQDAKSTHNVLMDLYQDHPVSHFYRNLNIICSQDIPCVLTKFNSDISDDVDREELLSDRIKLLILWQMTFPGIPCIYAGEKTGIEAGQDSDNRQTYPRLEGDEQLREWYQEMVALRKNYTVFRTGEWESFYYNTDVYGYYRTITGNQDVFGQDRINNKSLVLFNNSQNTYHLNFKVDGDFDEIVYDFLEDREIELCDKNLGVRLEPLAGRVLLDKRWVGDIKRQRKAGILLHLTSLPGQYGIGDLGNSAYDFIDFLEKSGQTYWQILPFNHPAACSPYQCYSAFAGNPLLIDPEYMVYQGWLSEDDLKCKPSFTANKVNYSEVRQFKDNIFKQAWQRFRRIKRPDSYRSFMQENSYWLQDYCLFMALTDYFDGASWPEWPQDIAWREEDAIDKYTEMLQEKIEYHRFLQYVFFTQWGKMKKYAAKADIKIVGDIPCFVAHNSSDVWVNPDLFDLDISGKPAHVAGVPPDYFSKTGQRWGNPLYRWDKMASNNYEWWRKRIQFLDSVVDTVRLDHFRGFEAFWEIPAEEETAVNGRWVKGPGSDFFEAINSVSNQLSILAENLGLITREVEDLRTGFGYPGMKVMQFMIKADNLDDFFIPLHEKDNFLYTGTHDNETLWQWITENSKKKKVAECYEDKEKICWQFIEKVYKSWAQTIIIPLQDFFCLGSEGRMNTPGTVGDNWEWRFTVEQLEGLASRLKRLTAENQRD